jgi:hypothetical protein
MYVFSDLPLPYREDTKYCRKRYTGTIFISASGGELYVCFPLFWGSIATVTSCRDAWLKLPAFSEAVHMRVV